MSDQDKQGKWQPQGDDAIKLAALRWFALTTESIAIQIYATDATRYRSLETILRACLKQMQVLRKELKTIGDNGGDCPPGYVQCGSECAPMCLEE